MARTQLSKSTISPSAQQRTDRTQARKMLKDFERQYIARNQDPQIYL